MATVDTYQLATALDDAPVNSLTLSASQADSSRKAVSINGNGDVTVLGLQDSTDLSNVDTTDINLTVTVTNSIDVTGNDSLQYVVDEYYVDGEADGSLILTAEQAGSSEAQTVFINGTENANVTITDLHTGGVTGEIAGGTDLSHVDPILHVTATITAETDVTENSTLSGKVDEYAVDDVDFRLTAEQADGIDVTGTGNVTVTDLQNAIDLSNVDTAINLIVTVTDPDGIFVTSNPNLQGHVD